MILPIEQSDHIVRASATLTASYVAGTVFSIDTHNYLGLAVEYTKGDETNMLLKVEISDDGTNYAQQVTESPTGGDVATALASRSFTATGNYSISITPIRGKIIKVSVLATGGTPTGTCAIRAITGWV